MATCPAENQASATKKEEEKDYQEWTLEMLAGLLGRHLSQTLRPFPLLAMLPRAAHCGSGPRTSETEPKKALSQVIVLATVRGTPALLLTGLLRWDICGPEGVWVTRQGHQPAGGRAGTMTSLLLDPASEFLSIALCCCFQNTLLWAWSPMVCAI